MNTKRFIYFFFVLALSFLTYSCYENKVYDWDMPGYLGSIYSWDYPNNPEYVHDLVYTSIKKEASKEEYQDITACCFAIKVFAKDYQAFTEQLPYYDIKVGFNVAIYVLYKIGFSGPHAVLLLNIFSYFFSGLLLFYLLKYMFPDNNFPASIISLLILWLPPVKSMAQNPTPDMFLFVFMLLFTISVLQKRSDVLRFVFLFCCVIIRPDYILFALTYLFAAFVYNYLKTNKNINFKLILHGFLLSLIYIFIIKYYHYPGWKDVFYDTFIYRRPVISAQEATFTFKEYYDFIILKLINFKKITLVSVILLGATFYLSRDLWVRILASLFFANIYIKFLFFPQGGTLRFFIGFVILLLIVFLCAVSKNKSVLKSGKLRNFKL